MYSSINSTLKMGHCMSLKEYFGCCIYVPATLCLQRTITEACTNSMCWYCIPPTNALLHYYSRHVFLCITTLLLRAFHKGADPLKISQQQQQQHGKQANVFILDHMYVTLIKYTVCWLNKMYPQNCLHNRSLSNILRSVWHSKYDKP